MMHETMTADYLWLIPALPLLGVLLNATIGARAGRGLVSIIAPGLVGGSFAVSLAAFAKLSSVPAGMVTRCGSRGAVSVPRGGDSGVTG